MSTCDNLKYPNRQLMHFLLLGTLCTGQKPKAVLNGKTVCVHICLPCTLSLKPAAAGNVLLLPAYSRCSTDTETVANLSL